MTPEERRKLAQASGLPFDQYNGLSPDARAAIDPAAQLLPAGTPGVPAPQTISGTPQSGLSAFLDSQTGRMAYGDTATAQSQNDRMARVIQEDRAAQQRAITSPEGQAGSDRRLRAFMEGGDYARASAEREASMPGLGGARSGQRIPTDVLEAAMTGRDPRRLAQWVGSTQAKETGGLSALMEQFDPAAKARREASDMRSAMQQTEANKERKTLQGFLAAIDPNKYNKDALARASIEDLVQAREFETTNQAMQQQRRQMEAQEQEQMQEQQFMNIMAIGDQMQKGTSLADLDLSGTSLTPQTAQSLFADPAMEPSLNLYRMGADPKAIQQALIEDMRKRQAPPGKLETQELRNGYFALTQDGKYKGMIPPERDGVTPTTKQRDSRALRTALEDGDFASAALLMGTVEEPGASVASPNIRRPANVEDARQYAAQLFGDNKSAAQTPAEKAKLPASLPNPADFTDKILRGPDGTRYRSTGESWEVIK